MRRIAKLGLVALLGLGLAGCAWWFTPPQAVLVADVTTGDAPLNVQFDLSGSTGQLTSFTLAFGDGSVPATGTDVTIAILHTYTTPGVRTATLTVQDGRGRTSTDSVIITVSAAPTATVSLGAFPASGAAPLPVQFWANIEAPAGRRIKHVALDYDGDGTPDDEADVDFETFNFWIFSGYTYNDPGTYTAALTVTDDTAQTFAGTATITVTSPPPQITLFSATLGIDTANFDDVDPTLTIAAGDTVDFDFAAQPAVGREIASYTLLCPGSNSPSASEAGLSEDPLVRNDLLRIYAAAGTYTATLQVWDDVGNSDLATLTVEVNPVP